MSFLPRGQSRHAQADTCPASQGSRMHLVTGVGCVHSAWGLVRWRVTARTEFSPARSGSAEACLWFVCKWWVRPVFLGSAGWAWPLWLEMSWARGTPRCGLPGPIRSCPWVSHTTGAPVRVSAPPLCSVCSPETQPWEEEDKGAGQGWGLGARAKGRSWMGAPACAPPPCTCEPLTLGEKWVSCQHPSDSFSLRLNTKQLLGDPSSVLAACQDGEGPSAPSQAHPKAPVGPPEDPRHLPEKRGGWPQEQHPVCPQESAQERSSPESWHFLLWSIARPQSSAREGPRRRR